MNTRTEAATPREPLAALELLQLLWGLDHALDRASMRMLREVGVTGPQRIALRLITEAGEIGPGELARQMRHHPATISSLLNRLERSALVERRPSPADRRRTVVVATERGRELGASDGGTIESAVRAVMRSADPATVLGCARVLAALADALEPLDDDADE